MHVRNLISYLSCAAKVDIIYNEIAEDGRGQYRDSTGHVSRVQCTACMHILIEVVGSLFPSKQGTYSSIVKYPDYKIFNYIELTPSETLIGGWVNLGRLSHCVYNIDRCDNTSINNIRYLYRLYFIHRTQRVYRPIPIQSGVETFDRAYQTRTCIKLSGQ